MNVSERPYPPGGRPPIFVSYFWCKQKLWCWSEFKCDWENRTIQPVEDVMIQCAIDYGRASSEWSLWQHPLVRRWPWLRCWGMPPATAREDAGELNIKFVSLHLGFLYFCILVYCFVIFVFFCGFFNFYIFVVSNRREVESSTKVYKWDSVPKSFDIAANKLCYYTGDLFDIFN